MQSTATLRTEGLKELDACLANIDTEDQNAQDQATSIAERLSAEGQLKGLGQGREIPKRLYTIEELRLNRIDTTALLSPEDSTLDGVQTQLQIALLALVVAVGVATADAGQAGAVLLGAVFFGGVDTIANGGGGRALALDTIGRILKPSYGCVISLCH